jgi:hypothetical protein
MITVQGEMIYNLPEVAINPIPRIPIIAATPDSMIFKNRSAAATNAIHSPTINRILVMGVLSQIHQSPVIIKRQLIPPKQ